MAFANASQDNPSCGTAVGVIAMWACPKCKESVEENFDACWNCGTRKDGTENPEFDSMKADAEFAEKAAGPELNPRDSNNIEPVIPINDPFDCPKCGQLDERPVVAELAIPNASLLSIVMDDFTRASYTFVSCSNCGFTEVYRGLRSERPKS